MGAAEGAGVGAPPVAADHRVFSHGDPGPWNFVWHEHEAVGLIDWDYLHPAPRLDDVAYAVYWFAPLRRDEFVLDWHHFPAIPNRRERVQAFTRAYGGLPRFDVSEVVVARMQATSDLIRNLRRQVRNRNEPGWPTVRVDRDEAEIAWMRDHRADFS